MNRTEDRAAGCLLGGAAGDALGYPVEFMEADAIFRRYGERGIVKYDLIGGKALISDDTQMTLFTAAGLLRAEAHAAFPTAAQYIRGIYEEYLNWLCTQDETFALPQGVARSPLLQERDLYSRRAPGGTCLSALASGKCGSFTEKLNRSKGCGGVMRVAPVAVHFAHKAVMPADVGYLAARAAAITHSHPLGYIPAAYLAELLLFLLRGEPLRTAAEAAWRDMYAIFDDDADLQTFTQLLRRAAELAEAPAGSDDLDAIRELGGGWVAEETVAIALYCVLRYSDSFSDALTASVNHDGDSDSTGAVTGNIMGALLGRNAMGDSFVRPLELNDFILSMAIALIKERA